MHVSRYRTVVYLQLFLIFIDLFINSFGLLFQNRNVVLLVIFVIQDVSLVFALIVLFLVFFNTYVFQAGLVYLLVRKFKTTIIVTIFYLALSVGLHVWTVTKKWNTENKYIWEDAFQALFVVQRVGSVLYYCLYKRTIIKLGDPRYYRDSVWIRTEFARVH
ncbi:transmembrane protein 138-like [Rhopilema esculentum]|uniref:transmembrane protein 138-like n=1 Tax=Rhopilema esculentum TaxID=499914 RepID=UPI0031D40CF2